MKQLTKKLIGIAAFGLLNGAWLVGSAHAALAISDIDGTATDGLYTYTEGATDTLGINGVQGGIFWNISTLSANQLFFQTIINVGYASANIVLMGLEANDDWLSAVITGTNGVPTLSYTGGDTATLNFNNGVGQWYTGDTITITFEPTTGTVPVPATLALTGLGLAALGYTRRKQAKTA